MRWRYWGDLTTKDFETLDPNRTIAVAPIAAHEQHGPHLPVSTDTILGEGMVREVVARLPDDLDVLFLPIMSVGKSNEHIRSPGTLTFSAQSALATWIELGESVHRAGLRKLIFVNSHGGNADLLAVVARELRVRCDMFCVHTSWRRFGVPAAMYTPVEDAHGIHAGDIETSLVLHFRPELARMDKVKNFVSTAVAMEQRYKRLRTTGMPSYGWMAGDINPDGAAGDATLSTAVKGRLTAEHQALGFIELLRDVSDFPLSDLS